MGARVGGRVGAAEAFGGDVGVDLGGGELGVTEHFLDAAEVGAGVEQVGGEAVAEFVRRDSRVQPGGQEMRFQSVLEGTRRQGARVVPGAPEDRLLRIGAATEGEPVGFHGPESVGTDGNQSFFAALAEDADDGFTGVEIADSETAEFGHAEAAGVEEFENGGVAGGHAGVDGASGFGGIRFGDGPGGCGEQGLHLLHGKESHQAFGEFGQGQVFDRGRGDVSVAEQVSVEGAEGREAEADGGRAEGLASEVAEVEAELLAGQERPIGGGAVLGAVPGDEFDEGLGVVAQGVGGDVAFGGEMGEEGGDLGVRRPWRIGRRGGRGFRVHDSRATS